MSAAVAQTCIGQPLSWLVLERHALAELEGAAARAADEHVAVCAACARALDAIKGDVRALPALPTVRPERSPGASPGESKDVVGHSTPIRLPFDSPSTPLRLASLAQGRSGSLRVAQGRSGRTGVRRWAIGAGVLLAAAAVVLLVIIRPKPTEPFAELSGPRVRVKGAGVVVMTLVRERDGNVTFDPADVRDSDRWKIQLTCAPGGGAYVEVVVEQPGEMPAVALPSQRFACANNVVLPGAFRITGGAATICAKLLPSDAPSSARPVLPVKACASVTANVDGAH